jgi:hypothetical protein
VATKPRISYIASHVPVGLLNRSIAQHKIDSTNYRNWHNKNELTSYIDTLYNHPQSDTYLAIRCQCGKEYNYVTKNDVPASNVTCECTRKVIEYS